MKIKLIISIALLMLPWRLILGQTSTLYQNLPVGKYAVGFKIITLIDESRITKREYNYLGERNEGERHKKFTVHIWYPAIANPGGRTITYGDYCYNSSIGTTDERIDTAKKNQEVARQHAAIERWFGKVNNADWLKLINTKMLAMAGAEPAKEKFPLLIGDLRPLSTTITNEMLASNGYIVAMIWDDMPGIFWQTALDKIPDFQFTINYLTKNNSIDPEQVGTFGFSGSGFTQVYLAMFDKRIKALADIESGFFAEGLYQQFSVSNYYDPFKLRVPFLHIFSRDLSKQEKYLGDFTNRMICSDRYRLILNQPALHHWDFASEGFTSTIMFDIRGEQKNNIRQSFEISSAYLLNFFNSVLKTDKRAENFLNNKTALNGFSPSLWDITRFVAAKPAPTVEELEHIIRIRGIDEAMNIVNNTIRHDSAAEIRTGFLLNSLGYIFMREKRYDEATALFKLNISLHPDEADWFDSISEVYELTNDKPNMKKYSQQVIDILNKKDSLLGFEQALKANAVKRLAK